MLRRRLLAIDAATYVRTAQFQRTSETNKALNKGERGKAALWISKSTREFDRPDVAQPSALKAEPTEHKKLANEQLAHIDEHFKQADVFAKEEVEKIFDFKQRRVQKYKDFFTRHGIVFAALYFGLYFAGLFFFWFILHNNYIDKHSLYEVIFVCTFGFMERENFFKRIEAWGDYIDFGFAFTMNEVCDFIRVPLSLVFFYTCRKTAVKWKPGLFKMNAPEK